MLNYFPTKGGISNTLIQKTIMSGDTLDYKKHLYLQLVQYFQGWEEDSLRNIQANSTRGAICLGPSGNLQGRLKLLALNSAKQIVGGAGMIF